MDHKSVHSDILVLGSGVAGLRAAAEAARQGLSVAVVSNGPCASPEILGLNAIAYPGDSLEVYCEDTMISGCRLNDRALVRTLGENVNRDAEWLEGIGVRFGRQEDGSYSVMQTLGARFPRLIRSGIASGAVETKALLAFNEAHGVRFFRQVDILGLVRSEERVIGAYGLNAQGTMIFFSAFAVVLAMGGSGAIRSFTTYPKNIVGDGFALAYLAGAKLMDMEFQQFEPCCLAWPERLRGKIMVTTLMRCGAILRNGEGYPFLADYGMSADNAQKGPLARAILSEIRSGRGTPHGGVYFDLTMLSDKVLFDDHKLFTAPVAASGIDLRTEMVEVVPAAHTQLGGIMIDPGCSTDVPGLFACGESTGGLHGANRVGGNAGAEVVVFGRIAGESAAAWARSCPSVTELEESSAWEKTGTEIRDRFGRDGRADISSIRTALDECMTGLVGPFRDETGLSKAQKNLAKLEAELSDTDIESLADYARYIHCRNMLIVSRLQVHASALRKESRGVFFRSDHPETDDVDWKKHIIFQYKESRDDVRITDAD